MKTIAYICSYELNENIAVDELSKQTAEIKHFCKCHNFELDEIFTETSTRDDFKPVLLNILSNYYNIAERLIITNPDIISRNEDFRDWISDELNRINIELICINRDKIQQEPFFEKKLSTFTEKIKNIPSLPEIITKSIEIMQNPNASASDLSKIISNDIGLTARVLKLVNSAYYGFPKQISTIQQAITILGFTTIKGIILSASIFKMFSPKGNQSFDYKKFWKHSLLVATASRILANKINISTKDDIFASAFLHDIGKIIFAQYDWDNYSKIFKFENITEEDYLKQEEHFCGLNHCEIANMVAYSWNLPEIFCDIITYHHSPMQSYKYSKECCIVYIANKIIQSISSNENLNIDNIPLDILENLNISGNNIIEVHDELVNIANKINDIDSFFQ